MSIKEESHTLREWQEILANNPELMAEFEELTPPTPIKGDISEQPVSKELYEEVNRYYSDNFAYLTSDQPTLSILTNIARHFAEWQREQMMDEWLKDRDGCFWDGVEEGKKAMEKQMMDKK